MQQQEIQKIKDLVRVSNLLSASEKAEWLNLTEIMNDKQLGELKNILMSAFVSPSLISTPPQNSPSPSLEKRGVGMGGEKEKGGGMGTGGEAHIPPLTHILNLPKAGTVGLLKVASKTKDDEKKSGFWQKLKGMLSEKELPPGHAEPTKELELAERVVLPNSIVIAPKKDLVPKVSQPPVIPKPPVKPVKPLEKTIETAVEKAIEKNLEKALEKTLEKKLEKLPEKPVEQPKSVAPVLSKALPSVKPPILETKPIILESQSVLKKNIPTSPNKNAPVTGKVLPVPDKPKILSKEDFAKQNLAERLGFVKAEKIVPEAKPEALKPANAEDEQPFVAGLENTNVLLGAKFSPKEPTSQVVVKEIEAIDLPPFGDFNSLAEVGNLDLSALKKNLVPALRKMVLSQGYHQVITVLEKSPLFQTYINTGLSVLGGKAGFLTSGKNTLSREDFERFVDVLRGVNN